MRLAFVLALLFCGVASAQTTPESALPIAAQLISAGRYDDALGLLRSTTPATRDEKNAVLFMQATALVYLRNFDGAAQRFADAMKRAHAERQFGEEAWLHNANTWVRWAQHDHARALEENDGLGRVAATAKKKERRELLLHYWWDKAYLLEEDPTTRSQAAQAKRTYERLADPRRNRDGVATLAAFFAVMEGNGAAALKSARMVDAENDHDVQDLYVLSLAYAAGGDEASAGLLRKVIAAANEYPMKPAILQRMAEERASH